MTINTTYTKRTIEIFHLYLIDKENLEKTKNVLCLLEMAEQYWFGIYDHRNIFTPDCRASLELKIEPQTSVVTKENFDCMIYV